MKCHAEKCEIFLLLTAMVLSELGMLSGLFLKVVICERCFLEHRELGGRIQPGVDGAVACLTHAVIQSTVSMTLSLIA